VKAIKAANNKTSDMIRVGEKLLIPVSEGAAPQIAAPVIAHANPAPAVKPTVIAPAEPIVQLREIPSQPVIEPTPAVENDPNALFEESPEVPVIRTSKP
jgi:LysM repeat protein